VLSLSQARPPRCELPGGEVSTRDQIILIGLFLILAVAVFFPIILIYPRHPQMVPAVNPDPRFSTRTFDVGGYGLIDYSKSDSLGRNPVIGLPNGSTLMIPVPRSSEQARKEGT
jgi:hypothetical protein